jgi:hypothetical protein
VLLAHRHSQSHSTVPNRRVRAYGSRTRDAPLTVGAVANLTPRMNAMSQTIRDASHRAGRNRAFGSLHFVRHRTDDAEGRRASSDPLLATRPLAAAASRLPAFCPQAFPFVFWEARAMCLNTHHALLSSALGWRRRCQGNRQSPFSCSRCWWRQVGFRPRERRRDGRRPSIRECGAQ